MKIILKPEFKPIHVTCINSTCRCTLEIEISDIKCEQIEKDYTYARSNCYYFVCCNCNKINYIDENTYKSNFTIKI